MKRNPWKLSTFILAIALAFALGLPIVSNAVAQKHPQPHMRAALTATRTAVRQLKKAAPNKGGHRVKAIAFMKKAEAEILKGIEFANKPK